MLIPVFLKIKWYNTHYILIFFISCNNEKKILKEITKIEVLEKEFDFGTVNINDTIIHTFKIKNISDKSLILKKIATSCGCTTFGKLDSIAEKNEYINFNVEYIAKKGEIDKVSNSLVVETNTEPTFTIFRLKGNVLN